MLACTLDVLKAGLKADPTVTPSDRARILTQLRAGPNPPPLEPTAANEPRLIRRAEAARRLSVSLRTVDALGASGVLPKRKLPGRVRASGFLESDLAALLIG